jgi:hypothetical protein
MTLNAGLFTSSRGEWETPQDLFDRLYDEFYSDLDLCATAGKCEMRAVCYARTGLPRCSGGRGTRVPISQKQE